MLKNLPAVFSSSDYYSTKDFEIRYSRNYFPRKRNRTSESVEFFFFLDGKMTFEFEEKSYPLKRNDVIYLPQGTVGTPLHIDEGVANHLFYLRISKNYISQLKNMSPDFGFLFDFTAPPKPQLFRNESILFNTVLARLLALSDELMSNRYGRETEIQISLNDLLLHLNRMAYTCRENTEVKKSKNKDTLFRNLIHYIELHFSEDLSLDHLADAFFVSKYYIAHLFKDNLGISVHQYITKKRLAHCKEALQNGEMISKNYALYGFRDYSSFYRAFKKEFGVSPKTFRENETSSFLKNSKI